MKNPSEYMVEFGWNTYRDSLYKHRKPKINPKMEKHLHAAYLAGIVVGSEVLSALMMTGATDLSKSACDKAFK